MASDGLDLLNSIDYSNLDELDPSIGELRG